MIEGSGLAVIGLGLIASLSWGASDFSGGLASKRASVFGVIVFSYATGIVLLVALALATAEALPSGEDWLWAAAAGLAGSAGLTAQYRALAVGRMGLNAPITAVLGAAIPVAFAGVSEGLPNALTLVGFALALAGVWLIARPDGSSARPEGMLLALGAGVGFGLFFILIDQVSEGPVFWPLVATRGAALAMLWPMAIAGGRAWRPPRAALQPIVVAGVLDVCGNIFFLLAAHAGRLDVATVVSSLYPAVTVMLAGLLLEERLSRWQAVGATTALIAVPLIAL